MKKIILILSLILFPLAALAAASPAITEGVQYKAVTFGANYPTRFDIPKNKVLVVEFFSYGCPWCFQFNPTLEAWLKTKPSYVQFERIPVTFEQGWDTYAKAYYTAEALGIADKITPAIFNAIHVNGEDLTAESAMQDFFATQGVSKQNFESAFDFSPGIGMQMQNDANLMMAYQVFVVPTIIVNGKYYTNPSLVGGNDQLLLQVVKTLVAKEKPANAK